MNKVHFYYWVALIGDGSRCEYHDGTVMRSDPIDTHDKYISLKNQLAKDLGATSKRLNILSLTLLHSRFARKEDRQ